MAEIVYGHQVRLPERREVDTEEVRLAVVAALPYSMVPVRRTGGEVGWTPFDFVCSSARELASVRDASMTSSEAATASDPCGNRTHNLRITYHFGFRRRSRVRGLDYPLAFTRGGQARAV